MYFDVESMNLYSLVPISSYVRLDTLKIFEYRRIYEPQIHIVTVLLAKLDNSYPTKPSILLHLYLMPRFVIEKTKEGYILVIELSVVAVIDEDPMRYGREARHPLG